MLVLFVSTHFEIIKFLKLSLLIYLEINNF